MSSLFALLLATPCVSTTVHVYAYIHAYIHTYIHITTHDITLHGHRWHDLGSFNGHVHALSFFGLQLFAGGEFTSVDGNPAKHVARYSSGAWQDLNGGTTGPVFSVLGEGECVYVCGSFGAVGEGRFARQAVNTGRWCPPDSSSVRDARWDAVDWGRSSGDVGQCKVLVKA